MHCASHPLRNGVGQGCNAGLERTVVQLAGEGGVWIGTYPVAPPLLFRLRAHLLERPESSGVNRSGRPAATPQ